MNRRSFTAGKRARRRGWFRFHKAECVLCGNSDNYKEFMTTPKPKDKNKRYTFRQYACDHHFL